MFRINRAWFETANLEHRHIGEDVLEQTLEVVFGFIWFVVVLLGFVVAKGRGFEFWLNKSVIVDQLVLLLVVTHKHFVYLLDFFRLGTHLDSDRGHWSHNLLRLKMVIDSGRFK